MSRQGIAGVALLSLSLGACGASAPDGAGDPAPPEHLGAVARTLGDDLVQVRVGMREVRDEETLVAYARCAALRRAQESGARYARHIRTNIDEEGGVWTADAIYTISPTLPRGSYVLDADVVVAACRQDGIPTNRP